MLIDQTFLGMLLSLALGALIGAQREMKLQQKKQKDFAGFRTYSFISLLGFLMGFLAFGEYHLTFLLLIGFLGVFMFTLLAYFSGVKTHHKIISMISEISAVLTFVVGVFIALGEYHLAITVSIIMTLVLLVGDSLHKFAKHLTTTEVFASLKFAIISFVILPFLPNVNYSLADFPFLRDLLLQFPYFSLEILQQLDVFNPYKIWLMVVFISGIAYVGYILMKILGQKGIFLTGFLGGLISSTATTSSFSIESKRVPTYAKTLAVGTTIACSTMFFRIIFEVVVINKNLLPSLFVPLVLMGCIGFIGAYIMYKKIVFNSFKKLKVSSPFAILPALEFAGFFVLVIFLSKLFSIILGSKGIYILSFFSGLTDVDAMTISLANLAKSGALSNHVASWGIIIAAISNTLVKAGIAYSLGTREYGKLILILFGIIIFSGLLIVFI
jgi:uncharacterized membrane protein (DUF4010 family)